MNSPKVNILLATYNGEKYLKAQLDSLIAQSYENIDIYIRDDGSSDQTVAVIEKYIRNNTSNRKIILLDNNGENLRCPKSFYEIFAKCQPADYYSLCDQDDLWYPDKVKWAVEALEQEQQDVPLLYYTACDYNDDKGNLIRRSPKQKTTLSLSDVLYYTPGSGFTMVINEMARQKLLLEVTPGLELHDRWLIRGVVLTGKAIYDERSSASHIRHEQAVTAGDSGNGNLLKNFIHSELCGDDAVHEKEALNYFAQIFGDQLNEKDKKLLTLFSSRNSIGRWFGKVFYPKRLRTRMAGEIALRMLFFLGKI